MPTDDVAAIADGIRAALKSQYHAALEMLGQAIELCPDEAWDDGEHVNSVWQIAYHTLFFAHLYIQPDHHAFRPWDHHRGEVQYPDCIAGPADPDSPLPLLPEPYTKEQALAYRDECVAMVNPAVDAIDVLSKESGFPWYPISKLEHQIVNIRHIQHGAAQIADRVRNSVDLGVDWRGASSGPAPLDR